MVGVQHAGSARDIAHNGGHAHRCGLGDNVPPGLIARRMNERRCAREVRPSVNSAEKPNTPRQPHRLDGRAPPRNLTVTAENIELKVWQVVHRGQDKIQPSPLKAMTNTEQARRCLWSARRQHRKQGVDEHDRVLPTAEARELVGALGRQRDDELRLTDSPPLLVNAPYVAQRVSAHRFRPSARAAVRTAHKLPSEPSPNADAHALAIERTARAQRSLQPSAKTLQAPLVWAPRRKRPPCQPNPRRRVCAHADSRVH